MQVQLTDEQLAVLVDLVDARLKAAAPEGGASGRAATEPSETKHDAQTLRALRGVLRDARHTEQALEAWEGYIEDRQVPSNPPPGQ
jgi:hypothetical protein